MEIELQVYIEELDDQGAWFDRKVIYLDEKALRQLKEVLDSLGKEEDKSNTTQDRT